MIKLIGKKRALTLGVVAGINAAIATAYLVIVDPMMTDIEGQRNAISAQISQLSTDTQNIKVEIEAFPDNYKKYQDLQKRGFFLNQDRFAAAKVLDDMRTGTELTGYTYKLDEIKPKESPLAEAAGGMLISSNITVENISSALDMDVYTLTRKFLTVFPAHIRISKFNIKRNNTPVEEALQTLKSGGGLVTANLELEWVTMVPKPAEGEAGADGAQPEGFRGR